jgi:stearoyl-CoA desaturase (delta-9 desaturase)
MRTELEALRARSSASHEQLLEQLQDWVARAKLSGIRQLTVFRRTCVATPFEKGNSIQ